MRPPEVEAVGYEAGKAVVRFEDGGLLRIEPEPDSDPVRVRGYRFDFEREGTAEGTATAFWTNGPDQRVVASRMLAAMEVEREIYRAYRRGGIKEDVWQDRFRSFWKILIRCRQIQGRLAACEIPMQEALDGEEAG
jgi:hypothetical protein